MVVGISQGVFILLIFAQSIYGQQGCNNGAGLSQQKYAKTSCNLNSAQNSGFNFNIPQQTNFQQPFSGQPSCVQQVGNLQPQLNAPPVNPQPGNTFGRPNQNLASDILAALHSLRHSQTNNPAFPTISCGSKQNGEQISVNQPLSQTSFTASPINKPIVSQATPTACGAIDVPKSQTFNIQLVPVTSDSSGAQQYPQYVVQSSQANQVPSQVPNYYVPSQQENSMAGQILTLPSPANGPAQNIQTNPVQSQPIVFTLQSPQSQTQPSSQSQPSYVYTLQSQPSTSKVNNQGQNSNNGPLDQSMMPLIMSQLQSPSGANNPLAAILPALLNTKQEKSSSMKSLLPLILNLLSERKPNCCDNCGCPNHNNQEPTIHGGYSNQRDYSQREDVILEADVEKVVQEPKSKKKNVIVNESEEISEEDDEYDDDDEMEDVYDD